MKEIAKRRELPDDAVFHRIVSPSFTLEYPNVRNANLLPSDGSLDAMISRWSDGTFRPRPVDFTQLNDVIVTGDGLIFDLELNLYNQPCENYPPRSIAEGLDAATDAVRMEPIERPHVLCVKRGAGNYGHWLLEMFPRAFFFKQAIGGGYGYIIPEAAGLLGEVVNTSLDMIGIPTADRLLFDGKARRFRHLAVVHGLTCHGPFMSPLVMDAIDALTTQVLPASVGRVYARRGPNSHRDFEDEDEIRNLAGQANYMICDPGDMKFSEQIAVFSGCDRVFGVMGAAMANIAFCRPNTEIFICAPLTMSDTFFWFIAGHRRLKYTEIRCPQANKQGRAAWDAKIRLLKEDFCLLF